METYIYIGIAVAVLLILIVAFVVLRKPKKNAEETVLPTATRGESQNVTSITEETSKPEEESPETAPKVEAVVESEAAEPPAPSLPPTKPGEPIHLSDLKTPEPAPATEPKAEAPTTPQQPVNPA